MVRSIARTANPYARGQRKLGASETMRQTFEITEFDTFGSSLARPECVLCKADGTIYCSDQRGGIMRIGPDGEQKLLGIEDDVRFRPNGIAQLRDGTLIFANLGSERGIWSITPDNQVKPYLLDHDGKDLGEVNFVMVAPDETVWFSVMTTAPHGAPLSAQRMDGYLGRVVDGQVTVMADGINWANEFKIDRERSALYVNETFVARTIRFDIAPDGSLTNRQVLATYEAGTYPDGLALDETGDLWITSVVSNRIFWVSKDGEVRTVFDDSDPERVAASEAALHSETLSRELIYQETDARIQNPTSMAFGGEDLRTVFVGSLNHTELRTFRSPVPGMAPVHWTW